MVSRSRPRIVLDEEVQVPNLIQDDGHVNNARLVYLIQLLYGVVLLQIEAEDCVTLRP